MHRRKAWEKRGGDASKNGKAKRRKIFYIYQEGFFFSLRLREDDILHALLIFSFLLHYGENILIPPPPPSPDQGLWKRGE